MSARRPTRSAGTSPGTATGCSGVSRGASASKRVGGSPSKRRERVARERDLLVDRLDLLARLGQRAFALALLDGGVDAGADALADQAEELLALAERALEDVALLESRASWT